MVVNQPPKFPGSQLGEYLEQVRQLHRSPPEGWVWGGMEDLLGSPESSSQFWLPQEPTPEYEDLYEALLDNPTYCERKACFRNAAMAALVHPEVEYAEGLSGHMIPIHHAWNVLPDGTIVDCTWCGSESSVGSPGAEYIGIVVPKDVLRGRLGDPQGMSIFWWQSLHEMLENPPDWLFADYLD